MSEKQKVQEAVATSGLEELKMKRANKRDAARELTEAAAKVLKEAGIDYSESSASVFCIKTSMKDGSGDVKVMYYSTKERMMIASRSIDMNLTPEKLVDWLDENTEAR